MIVHSDLFGEGYLTLRRAVELGQGHAFNTWSDGVVKAKPG